MPAQGSKNSINVKCYDVYKLCHECYGDTILYAVYSVCRSLQSQKFYQEKHFANFAIHPSWQMFAKFILMLMISQIKIIQ